MSERYIYLKNGNDLVKQEKFKDQHRRVKIVDKWKKMYGKKFADLTITEDPEIKKEKPAKLKSGKHTYGHLFNNGKKSYKGFTKSWNGYKD